MNQPDTKKDQGSDDQRLRDAVASGDQETVTTLLEEGANISAASDNGTTLLMTAVVSYDLPMIRFLLRHGADPNQLDDRGFNALDVAQEKGAGEQIANCLREAGALTWGERHPK